MIRPAGNIDMDLDNACSFYNLPRGIWWVSVSIFDWCFKFQYRDFIDLLIDGVFFRKKTGIYFGGGGPEEEVRKLFKLFYKPCLKEYSVVPKLISKFPQNNKEMMSGYSD